VANSRLNRRFIRGGHIMGERLQRSHVHDGRQALAQRRRLDVIGEVAARRRSSRPR